MEQETKEQRSASATEGKNTYSTRDLESRAAVQRAPSDP